MSKSAKTYSMPDYTTVTDDVEVYAAVWHQMAAPIERELGLTLHGFDPTFVFLKGNAQRSVSTVVDLPVWFVRDLSNLLTKKNKQYNSTLDYTRLL